MTLQTLLILVQQWRTEAPQRSKGYKLGMLRCAQDLEDEVIRRLQADLSKESV